MVVAQELQRELLTLPVKTHGTLASHRGISRGRVCQYLRLLNLPPSIASYMVDPANAALAANVTEKDLQSLVKTPAGADIHHLFEALLRRVESL